MDELLFFTAAWCKACKKVYPLLSESSGVHIKVVDADAEPGLFEQYEIKSLPTFILLKNGKVAKRTTNMMSAEQLKEFIGG